MPDVSLIVLTISLPFIVAAFWLFAVLREHRKRKRRKQRRIRNIAYQRAWDWIYRRPKHRFLTHR